VGFAEDGEETDADRIVVGDGISGSDKGPKATLAEDKRDE
jgi:hypothetical protein